MYRNRSDNARHYTIYAVTLYFHVCFAVSRIQYNSQNDQIKYKKYYAVRTVPKSNKKIIEIEAHTYMAWHINEKEAGLSLLKYSLKAYKFV